MVRTDRGAEHRQRLTPVTPAQLKALALGDTTVVAFYRPALLAAADRVYAELWAARAGAPPVLLSRMPPPNGPYPPRPPIAEARPGTYMPVTNPDRPGVHIGVYAPKENRRYLACGTGAPGCRRRLAGKVDHGRPVDCPICRTDLPDVAARFDD